MWVVVCFLVLVAIGSFALLFYAREIYFARKDDTKCDLDANPWLKQKRDRETLLGIWRAQ